MLIMKSNTGKLYTTPLGNDIYMGMSDAIRLDKNVSSVNLVDKNGTVINCPLDIFEQGYVPYTPSENMNKEEFLQGLVPLVQNAFRAAEEVDEFDIDERLGTHHEFNKLVTQQNKAYHKVVFFIITHPFSWGEIVPNPTIDEFMDQDATLMDVFQILVHLVNEVYDDETKLFYLINHVLSGANAYYLMFYHLL